MRVARKDLTVLFNRLYDRGDDRFTIEHPSSDIGPLVTVELDEYDNCTVRFETRRDEYVEARQTVRNEYGEEVYEDLPEPDHYLKAVLASGIISIENFDEVRQFVERYGDPDLMAGHPPVVAGFDTNLLSWRIDQILGLRDPDKGVGYLNGFVLATGVRDELDWDYKCHDTDPFVDAHGPAFEEYWNQPLGSARLGRLGLLTYRKIRDIQQADEIESETGDEAIVQAYDAYDDSHRSQVLLFSNDRNFVERARSHTLLAQHIEFPHDLPTSTTATWRQLEHLLYTFAIVFGVVEVPTTTVYGVWRGKDQLDWQEQRVKLDCRSTTMEPKLEGDLSIVESYQDIDQAG